MNEAEKIFREVEKKRMDFLESNRVTRKIENNFETVIIEDDAEEILRKVKRRRLLMGIKSGKEFNKKTLIALANFSLMKIRADNRRKNQNVRKGQDDER